jgi:hypothetical protein
MPGGKQRQTSESTQTQVLPANQQANVDLLMQGIGDLYQSGGPQYYSGQNYTTATPEQQQARQMASGYATGAGQNYANTAVQSNQSMMDPNRIFDLQKTPGYGAVRQGIQDTVTRNLTENILPQGVLSATGAGDLGGSRSGMMDALAMGRTSGELASALGQLDLGVSQANRGSYEQAMNRAPGIYQLGVAPSNTLENVGGANRADAEGKLQADMQKWDFQQNQLPRLLSMVQALTGSAGQYGGTTTGTNTQTTSGGGGIGQILGPLMMLGSMFMGGAPAAGAAAAGGAGQLAGRGIGPF